MTRNHSFSDDRAFMPSTIATICLAIALISGTSLLAQMPVHEFAKGLGGTAYDQGNAMAVDATGNIYVTGAFNGTVDFDPGAGTHNLTAADTTDAFVAKFDNGGNLVWAFRIGGIGTGTYANAGLAIAVSGTGNLVVMGQFSGTADLNPGAGTANRTARAGMADLFLATYDPAGNYLWGFSLPANVETQYSKQNALAIDSQNNIIIGGYFNGSFDANPGSGKTTLTAAYSSINNADAFVAKYNSTGGLVWAFRVGNSGWEQVHAVAVDMNDNVLVTGGFGFSTGGTVNFNPGGGTKVNVAPPGGSPGYGDIFVAKYTKDGKVRWAFGVGGSARDRSIGIASDASNAVLLTGYFNNTVDFNPSSGTANLSPYHANAPTIFAARYDSNGAYSWALAPANGWGQAIASDDAGNVTLTGTFAVTGDFDPSENTATLTSMPSGHWNGFVARYTSGGAYDYAFNIAGTDVGSYSHSKGLALDGNGNTYITGLFATDQGACDFDPSAASSNLTSAGSLDIFFAKYNPMTLPKHAVHAAESTGTGIQIAPNPFTNGFTLGYQSTPAPARVQVIDMMGQVVETKEIAEGSEEITLGSDLPTGAYLVEIIEGDIRRRTMVQKVR